MALLTFRDVSLDFGDQTILRSAELVVAEGERVCLLGRNGAGKTTILKLIRGELAADSGEIRLEPGAGVSQLAQTLPDA